jgi:dTDP-4-dehydrorhamnose 3,5-epimerase-like enzyme
MKARQKAGEAELLDVDCKIDDRGYLYQIYGNLKKDHPPVKRVYVIGNHSKGVVRGFHKHRGEYKYFFVVSGSAKFLVEAGEGEPTPYILSPRRPAVLVVPPGLFHGWVSLDDDTVIVGMSNYSLEESEKDDVRMDPFAFGKDIWESKPR